VPVYNLTVTSLSNDAAPIIITEQEFRKGEAIFRNAAEVRCIASSEEEDALAAAIRQAGSHFAIVGPRAYRDALYAALPRGGMIARFGVGYEGIDINKASRAGLLCTNTPKVLNQSVAEFTVLLILAAARRLVPMARGMANNVWTPIGGKEVRGKMLAIIGCGQIGSAVARIVREGFQMNVNCVSRRAEYEPAVQNADFVSLHIPATPQNLRFMNRDRLAMLQPHAWLINTSRGAVLDEDALYDVLAAGRIAGAALDVFQHEPYTPADPARDLRTLPNVILTPHTGSNTQEASHAIAERALGNVLLARAGNFAAMDLLNPEVLKELKL
jgi:phosphoglycerate dehydrogenase-like enzyme